MDCGVPFCHNGCPLGNLIPDWNDLVYRGDWHEAIDQLHATNNFPEFTGLHLPGAVRVAPACSTIDDDAGDDQADRVLAIVDRAFDEGWVVAARPERRTGKTRRRRRLRPGRAGRRRRAEQASATASPSTSATRRPAA